jgi:hypothetical protein
LNIKFSYRLGSIFGDSHSRRQIAPVTTTSPSLNHPTSSQQQQTSTQQTNLISVNTTNSLLARAFAILIRQITDLLVRYPATLSASSLYHDVLTTSDEQNTVDNIQVNKSIILKSSLLLFLE